MLPPIHVCKLLNNDRPCFQLTGGNCGHEQTGTRLRGCCIWPVRTGAVQKLQERLAKELLWLFNHGNPSIRIVGKALAENSLSLCYFPPE